MASNPGGPNSSKTPFSIQINGFGCSQKMVDVAGNSREGTFGVGGSGATGFDGKFRCGSSLRENVRWRLLGR